MQKKCVDKITQAMAQQLPLREPDAPVIGYYGENKDILLVPNLDYTSVVVQKYCDNKLHSRKVGDLRYDKWREAEKRALDYIADIVNKRYQTQSLITVNKFNLDNVEPYSEKNHKDSSGFKQRLKPFIEAYSDDYVHDISTLHVTGILNRLPDELSSTTVGKYLAAISKFFSLAIEHGLIDKNPCSRIKKPKKKPCVKRYLSNDEIIAFIEACLREQNQIHALCLLLSLMTGLRQGNVRSIELSWFNHDFTVLNIPDSKTNIPICHQLSPVSTEIIKLALVNSDEKYLFPSRVIGKFMSKPTKCMARIRHYVQEKTGITEHFYAHILRKNFATTQLSVTGNLNVVRENLAHSDIKTTLIYAFNQTDKLRDANTKTAVALLGGRSLTSFINQPVED